MYVPTTSEIISMLRQESVAVDEYITDQQYLTTATNVDAVDEEGILTQCYLLIISELNDLDIYFSEELDVLLSSWYEAERIYHLYCWIQPANQVRICNNIKLIPVLEDVINNSLDDELLEDWLTNIYDSLNQDKHKASIKKILPYVYTKSKFRNLLKYVYGQVEHKLTDYTQPIEVITSYIQEMAAGRQDAETALNILRLNKVLFSLTDEQQQILQKSIKYYDMAKLEPSCISDYAWASTIQDVSELPDYMKAEYDRLEYEHHTTTEHHIEYYLANKDVPVDTLACILLAIGCYDKDVQKMKEDALRVVLCGGDLFDDNTKKLFLSYIQYFIIHLGSRRVHHDS